MSSQLEKILDAAQAIASDRPTPQDTAWLARQLVQATLPHSDPKDAPAWVRHNGNLTLTIQPAYEQGKSLGIPYGTIPRLLLFWITTEAIKHQSRRLELGNSLSDFMRELDIVPTGGRWGTITSLRKQIKRLFAARISFDYTDKKTHATKWLNMDVAPKGELWWDYKEPEKGSLFNSWIQLGEEFYEAITAAPVPVDMRALKVLRKSPLALDLYAWATYSAYAANQNNKPRSVSWDLLHKQFGSEYAEVRNFQTKAVHAFKKIGIVYPDLKWKPVRGGICIMPSTPAVLPAPPANKDTRHKRVFGAQTPSDSTVLQSNIEADKIKGSLSEKTRLRAIEMVKEAGTGWDVHFLEQAFYEYAAKKGETLKKPDQAFLGFVKKKIIKKA